MEIIRVIKINKLLGGKYFITSYHWNRNNHQSLKAENALVEDSRMWRELAELFLTTLRYGKVSLSRKIGIAVPMFKKGKKDNSENDRGITFELILKTLH